MKRILLMSGGVDSSCIYEMKKDQIDEMIYLDYGHQFMDKEIERLKEMDIEFKIVKLDKLNKDENNFFFGRNLRFIIKVRELYPNDNVLVYMGNCAEDNFSDNTREYFYRLEQVINNSYPNTLRIICPLENMTKKEIYELLMKLNKNSNPYWCDKGEEKPCGKCHSCQCMIEAGII